MVLYCVLIKILTHHASWKETNQYTYMKSSFRIPISALSSTIVIGLKKCKASKTIMVQREISPQLFGYVRLHVDKPKYRALQDGLIICKQGFFKPYCASCFL